MNKNTKKTVSQIFYFLLEIISLLLYIGCVCYAKVEKTIVFTISIANFDERKRINMTLKNNSTEIYEVDKSFYLAKWYNLDFYYMDNTGNKIFLEKYIYGTADWAKVNKVFIAPGEQLDTYVNFLLKEGEFTEYDSYTTYRGKIIYLEYEGHFLPVPEYLKKIFIVCKVKVNNSIIESNVIEFEISKE